MRLRDDERAQSVQIGAVLLFATFVVAFASYQSFVVPDQNQAVEFDHNQQVQGELQELRNVVVSMAGGGSPRSTSMTLGTTYPNRLVAMNPPSSTGSLRTVDTDRSDNAVVIRNAEAQNLKYRDVWNGTARRYDTGRLVYQPNYNQYTTAPTTVYENSVVFNRFESSYLTTSGQTLIGGGRISLVTLGGALDRTTSGSVSVDVEPVSSSTHTVAVTGTDSGPIEVDVPTTLPVSATGGGNDWEDLLADELADGTVQDVTAIDESGTRFVRITLAPGTYDLRMAHTGVGTSVTDPAAAYVVPVDDGDRSVPAGATRDVAVEVRDAYNNPVSGATVHASAESGSLADASVESDEDGRAVFEYTAPPSGEDDVRFSIDSDYAPDQATFDPDRMKTTQVHVAVDGSDVSAFWFSPIEDNSGGLSDCSASSCTFDVGAHGDRTFTLRAGTDPTFDDVTVEFRTNDSDVGTVSPQSVETGPEGEAATEFTARSNGNVAVFFGSSSGRDLLELAVTGFDSDPGPSGDLAYDDADRDGEFDPGETTYTRSDLEDGFDDEAVDLVVPSDVGDLSSNSLTIRANSVTAEVDFDATTGNLLVESTGGDLRVTGQSLSAANGDATLTGAGAVVVDGSTVESTTGQVDVDGGTVSARNADLSAANSALQLTSDGTLDATGAGLSSSTSDVALVSNGDMLLDSATLTATNGDATADLGGGNAVLHVDQAVIDDTNDTLDRSPNGVTVQGTPSEGSVE